MKKETAMELFKNYELSLKDLDEPTQQRYIALGSQISGQGNVLVEESSSWEPTLLKLVHPVTDDPKMPKDAETGDYFYDGILLKRPCKFVLAYSYPTRVRFVQDVDKAPSCAAEKVDLRGRGDHDQSVSIYGIKCADCPYGDQPYRQGKATNCSTQRNVLIIPETLEGIFILRFAKSSWSVGTSLIDMVKSAPNGPWSRFFYLDSKIEKRPQGSGKYAVPTISPSNPEEDPVPDHLCAFANFIHDKFAEFRTTKREEVIQRVEDATAHVSLGSAAKEDAEDFEDGM